jgi:hypothetical protein
MKHSDFLKVLKGAVVCHGQTLSAEDRKKDVRVQWDPERGPALEMLPYRSIQIGISGAMAKWWIEEGIVGIEDVTGKAKGLWEDIIEPARAKGRKVEVEECVEKGLMPRETEYVVPEDVEGILGMQTETRRALAFATFEEARKRDMTVTDASKAGMVLPEKKPPLLVGESGLAAHK